MTDRQRRVLAVLEELDRTTSVGRKGWSAGRIAKLSGLPGSTRGRADAGMTRTLDALEKLDLVRGLYGLDGRNWEITARGQEALEA